jgi:glycogen(starch) synthase
VRKRGTGVLLIGDYPPPMGGISVHVQQLHRGFRQLGLHCRVLDVGKRGRPDPGVIDGRGYQNFARHLFGHAANGWLLHFHTSGNNPKAWAVALGVAVAGQVFRTPTVITLHSGLLPHLFQRSPALRRKARLALLGYGHVVAVSSAIHQAVLDLGLREERVSMYPAFCAPEVRPGEAPKGLASVRARRDPLLAVAHHPSPVYGRKLMFEALANIARLHPRVGLAIFGAGTGSPEFLADGERFGVVHLLEDFGELSNEQTLEVIRSSDVFIRPTSADGDSVSVREALALCVPVVATDAALRPPGTIVCRAGNAEDLARKVEWALEHPPAPAPQPDSVAFLSDIYRRLRAPACVERASNAVIFHPTARTP